MKTNLSALANASAPPGTNDIRALKPPIEIPNGWLWVWAVAGVLVLVVAAWFAWRFGAGEWVGSLFASVVFVVMVGRGFGSFRSIIKVSVVMFALHSAGYFLGGKLMQWLTEPAGVHWLGGLSRTQVSAVAKLAWGFLYGLGFGASLGYAFFTFQNDVRRSKLAHS